MSDRTSTLHHSGHASHAGHDSEKSLAQEAENLLERLGNGGEKTEALAGKVRHALEASKEKAANIREYVKTGIKHTETTIKERPWTSVGVAAAAGVGLGLLIGLLSRRGD